MIKLTATALIYSISPVIEIPSKTGGQSFFRRDLILDDSWTKDGNTYPNYVLIEFSGDKIAQLDHFMPGQRVTVEAYVSGREYQGKYYNSIRGQSVTLYQTPHAAPTAPQAMPGGYPPAPSYPQGGYPQQAAYPPQPAYSQQSQYPPQGGYAPAPPQAPMPGPHQGGNLGPDDLPFR